MGYEKMKVQRANWGSGTQQLIPLIAAGELRSELTEPFIYGTYLEVWWRCLKFSKEFTQSCRTGIFKNTKAVPINSNGNIEINYFQTLKDAKQYLDGLDKDKWEVLRFTPSLFNKEHHEQYSDLEAKTSHKVIGQEFDAVAIAIDQYFKYDEFGDLIYIGGTYYAPVSMLLQNITRARKRLNIVLINNETLLRRCLGILSH